ncbi:MAG: YceI family protein [Chloroflexota bacterium]|nr:YceI family protein [Chloroflexota bacterium]
MAILVLSVACGQTGPGGQGSSAPASPPASAVATAAPGAAASTPAGVATTAPVTAAPVTAAPSAGGVLRFQLVPNQSSATFRVREQLAGVELPNDAVGTTRGVSGQIALRSDGSLVGEDSKITVDLRQLQTDNSRRDGYIKSSTLATDRFPSAEFVPAQATGAPNPLPESGEYAFQLTGPMTIKGAKKDVTWDVSARREGSNLTATATTNFTFGDFNLVQPRVPLVLSITDDIRLEVNLVASQASA